MDLEKLKIIVRRPVELLEREALTGMLFCFHSDLTIGEYARGHFGIICYTSKALAIDFDPLWFKCWW